MKKQKNSEERPWGKYQVLLEDDNCKVKKITVCPKSRLSYQMHHKRAEVWVIVKGDGTVTIDGETKDLVPNSVVLVPYKTKHRIQNTSDEEELVFIETQLGTYFGEDDIVRYEDDYDRK
jgi:mannose-6-phosphate isomerase